MSDTGSSVTLILYKLDPEWMSGTEPILNLLAAAAQRSRFTHVELAIGEGAGAHGEMVNVLRIFNDSTGAELTQRTGKNPNYQYVQIGCSSHAASRMLQFARSQVGKPFSSTGMFRSMVWPRTSDLSSFYCAELVAACLKTGGLMSRDSNPGAATPYSLYKMYKAQGAVMANPCTLRQQFGASHLRPLKIAALAQRSGTSAPRLPTTTTFQNSAGGAKSSASSRRPSESPACMSFTTLQQRGAADTHSLHDIRLSLDSLTMERMSMRRL